MLYEDDKTVSNNTGTIIISKKLNIDNSIISYALKEIKVDINEPISPL